MTPEQQKAEMITLHTNLMDAQSKVKKDIKILTEKRDLLLARSGGLTKMTDSEKRNYDMFNDLINHANTHLIISQAAIKKYQDLFNRQVEFIKKYQTPLFKISFIEHLTKNLNNFIESEISNSQLNDTPIPQQ